jgi:CBS domain-containing protein
MVRTVICAHPEMRVDELIRIMVDHGISAMPVIDSGGRPIGIVSQRDVLRELRENPGAAGAGELQAPDDDEESLSADLRAEIGTSRCARHIMTPLALCVSETTSIARAAALMAYERIHRVIVVDGRLSILGILSSLDIARWLARDDGYAIP